jgi:hypothetical protein
MRQRGEKTRSKTNKTKERKGKKIVFAKEDHIDWAKSKCK